MLIVCDFDGTVTATDTNTYLAKRFAPDAVAAWEGRLSRGEVTVRETLTNEFLGLKVPLNDLVDVALDVPVRAGFKDFVEAAWGAEAEVILLSSGFRQIIEPILEREGLLHRKIPLIANDLYCDNRAEGLQIEWRDLPVCTLCNEHCKRHDVTALRAGAFHNQRSFDRVIFVGDGFSDRCGADIADRIFARDSLAIWLDERDITWEHWDDFNDIAQALKLR